MLDRYQEEIIQKRNLAKIKKAFWFLIVAFLTEIIGYLAYKKIAPAFLPPYKYVFYARPIYQVVMLISGVVALVSIGILKKYKKRSAIFHFSLILAIVVFLSAVYNLISSILLPVTHNIK